MTAAPPPCASVLRSQAAKNKPPTPKPPEPNPAQRKTRSGGPKPEPDPIAEALRRRGGEAKEEARSLKKARKARISRTGPQTEEARKREECQNRE